MIKCVLGIYKMYKDSLNGSHVLVHKKKIKLIILFRDYISKFVVLFSG